ncbi:MAG: type II toxin-antitoxin system Phd/YefM family antitoxin [Acidimicrobiia bacterium]|nr:type II toxin-antitoxin system Phd/YefM family antitoxin [Acidimicrobiia bacterium]
MGTIGIRDLSRHASQVIDQVSSTGSPMIVTKHGRPVAAVVAVDPDALEDFILATAPEYVAARRAADADLTAGRTRPAAAVIDQVRRHD